MIRVLGAALRRLAMPKRKAAALSDDRGVAQSGAADYGFYADQRYWARRYADDAAAFEWFASPAAVLPLLQLLIPRGAAVLDMGCGTSGLLSAMRGGEPPHEGRLLGVDRSAAAVAELGRRSTDVGEIEYAVADAADLSALVADGELGAVVEKGTLAGLLAAEDGGALVAAVLTEAHRALGGNAGVIVSLSPWDPFSKNEAKNGLNVVQELLLPPLQAAARASGHRYSCAVHSSETFAGTWAYVFTKRRRANTRSAARSEEEGHVEISLHEH